MSAATIQQMTERIAALVEERLAVRGTGLQGKHKRARGLLPRKLRPDLDRLAEAALMAQNPKLYLQIDQEKTAAAYDRLSRHLTGVNRWGRARGKVLDRLASVAFSLLVLAVLVLGLLYWRGLI